MLLVLSYFFFLASFAGCVKYLEAPSRLLPGMSQVDYNIYLPDGYEENQSKRYPILYLLHGGGCSNTDWERFGNMRHVADSLIGMGKAKEMIIVCPEANKKNMIWFNDDRWRYEDFFFTEFIPYIEATYRVAGGKENRSVAGFSMGGGGSVVYGLHHPEMFFVVYAMSAYLRRQPLDFLKNDPNGEWRQQVVERNNPIKAVTDATGEKISCWKGVKWFIDCGDHDFTLEGNMDMIKAFRSKGIHYEMRVNSGGHDWKYWKRSLIRVLEYVSLK